MAQVLSPVREHPAASHPALVVGMGTGDDAGVYALEDGRALVQTVDIFTPVVDSPTDWGRIAAANALSDIYAMGASPLTSLQYLGWPRDQLSLGLASEVIAGGMDVMNEAGVTVIGGHSIDSPEPTYGFAVTGMVRTDELISNAGGKPGDVLLLTKPLGMGIITTAIKRNACPPDLERQAIGLMTVLNAPAGSRLHGHGATAATDVTGFGLLGHLRELCEGSGVGAEVAFDQVPILEGVAELLDQGMWPSGSQRNFEFIYPEIDTNRPVRDVRLLSDAQTSGGLIVAIPLENVERFQVDVPGATVIGRLTDEKIIRLI